MIEITVEPSSRDMAIVYRIEHSIIGPVTWDSGKSAWSGWVQLPPFAGYRAEAIDESARIELRRLYRQSGGEWIEPAAPIETKSDRRFRDAEFPLLVEPSTSGAIGWKAVQEWWTSRGKPPAEPSESQSRAFEQLVAAPGEVAAAIMALTFDMYRTAAPSWRRDELASPEAANVSLPQIESADGLKRLLRLTGVRILGQAHDGLAYCQFRFVCTWDDEHGYEVFTHGDRAMLELPAS